MDAEAPYGLISRQRFSTLMRGGQIRADRLIEPSQLQPASLDLRLGREAYRLRASFLPGRGVERARAARKPDAGAAVAGRRRRGAREGHRLSRAVAGAARPAGIHVRRRQPEELDRPARHFHATDRRRLRGVRFRAAGLPGPALGRDLPAQLISVRVREGSKLNQLRLRARAAGQEDMHSFALSDDALRRNHEAAPLVDGPLKLREGLIVHVGLAGAAGEIVGYRAIKNGDVIDVDRPGHYPAEDFWEPIRARARRPPDPRSRRVLHPRLAREDADPRRSRRRNGADRSRDRRVPRPLRRLLRSRLRPGPDGAPCARAVLEVRCRDVPVPARRRPAGRPPAVYEELAGAADELYGATAVSNYQGQGLKLSKHFRDYREG